MLEYARKIYLLRERLDRTEVEIAHRAGMSIAEYFDLEYRDENLLTGPSLRQVVRLAEALDISPLRLLGSEYLALSSVKHCPFLELREEIHDHLVSHQLTVSQFEAELGLPLQDFLQDPEMLWDQPIAFIQSICRPLGIHWLQLIPPTSLE